MSVPKSKIQKNSSIPVTIAASNSAKQVTTKTKLSSAHGSGHVTPKKTKSKNLSSTPDKEGKLVSHINNFKSFIQKNLINPRDLPIEITPEKFLKVFHDVIQEKIQKGELVTTSAILGDCFEKLGIDFQHVRKSCADVLIDWSLPLLKHYLNEIVGNKTKEILFNGAGGFSDLSAVKKAKLIDMLDKATKANNLDDLSKIGIMYATNFSIGGSKYKDAGFVIKLGDGEWLFLADLEFKTSGSKGINAQSATAFVRFAGAENSEQVTFSANSKMETTTVGNLLFNPMDLNSHIATKAGKQDSFVTKPRDEILDSKSLKDRLRSQKKERAKILDKTKKTNFGDNLSDLAVLVTDVFKVGVDANLKGIRGYIYKFVATL